MSARPPSPGQGDPWTTSGAVCWNCARPVHSRKADGCSGCNAYLDCQRQFAIDNDNHNRITKYYVNLDYVAAYHRLSYDRFLEWYELRYGREAAAEFAVHWSRERHIKELEQARKRHEALGQEAEQRRLLEPDSRPDRYTPKGLPPVPSASSWHSTAAIETIKFFVDNKDWIGGATLGGIVGNRSDALLVSLFKLRKREADQERGNVAQRPEALQAALRALSATWADRPSDKLGNYEAVSESSHASDAWNFQFKYKLREIPPLYEPWIYKVSVKKEPPHRVLRWKNKQLMVTVSVRRERP